MERGCSNNGSASGKAYSRSCYGTSTGRQSSYGRTAPDRDSPGKIPLCPGWDVESRCGQSLSVLSKRAAGEEPGSAESPDLGIASTIHTAKWLTSQLGTAKVCWPPQVLVKPQSKGGFNTKIFLSLGNDHFKGFRPTLFQQGKSSQLCLPDFRGGFVATRPHWAASIPRRALLLLPTSAPRTKDFQFPLKYHCHPVSLKLHKTESENVFAAEAFVSSASHVDLLVLNSTQPHAAEAQRNPQDSLPPLSHLIFTQI